MFLPGNHIESSRLLSYLWHRTGAFRAIRTYDGGLANHKQKEAPRELFPECNTSCTVPGTIPAFDFFCPKLKHDTSK